MLYDDTSFLFSLAAYAAGRAAAQVPPVVATLGTNLFINQAPGDGLVAVLRTFGGSNGRTNPKATINVQLRVEGDDDVAAKRYCQALFEALALDAAGRELRMAVVPNVDPVTEQPDGRRWLVVDAQTIGRPGQLGRDADGRVSVVANVSFGFCVLPN